MTLPETVTRQDRLLTVSTNASMFPEGLMDAGMIKAWVDQGITEQGCDGMTYISPPLPTYAR